MELSSERLLEGPNQEKRVQWLARRDMAVATCESCCSTLAKWLGLLAPPAGPMVEPSPREEAELHYSVAEESKEDQPSSPGSPSLDSFDTFDTVTNSRRSSLSAISAKSSTKSRGSRASFSLSLVSPGAGGPDSLSPFGAGEITYSGLGMVQKGGLKQGLSLTSPSERARRDPLLTVVPAGCKLPHWGGSELGRAASSSSPREPLSPDNWSPRGGEDGEGSTPPQLKLSPARRVQHPNPNPLPLPLPHPHPHLHPHPLALGGAKVVHVGKEVDAPYTTLSPSSSLSSAPPHPAKPASSSRLAQIRTFFTGKK